MPTPGEQKALLFLGAVALLGGAVRLFGSDAPSPPTAAERSGLTGQLAATDSAIGATAASKAARAAAKSSRSAATGTNPKPPKGAGKSPSARSTRGAGAAPGPHRMTDLDSRPATDVDRATIAELRTLPGIGPALAARIVADRNAHGAFGSLEALDGVPGIGPTLIGRLAPYVTFSGPRRPLTANGSGGGARASGRVVGLIGGRP